jgi:hypothetical protein
VRARRTVVVTQGMARPTWEEVRACEMSGSPPQEIQVPREACFTPRSAWDAALGSYGIEPSTSALPQSTHLNVVATSSEPKSRRVLSPRRQLARSGTVLGRSRRHWMEARLQEGEGGALGGPSHRRTTRPHPGG